MGTLVLLTLERIPTVDRCSRVSKWISFLYIAGAL